MILCLKMVNQQLSDYINQQRQAGVSDAELEKRLTESGWERNDVTEALGDQKFNRVDSSSPGVYELGLIKTNNEEVNQNIAVVHTPSIKTEHENFLGKKRSPLLGFIIIAIVFLLMIGGVYWYVTSQQKAISPESGQVQGKRTTASRVVPEVGVKNKEIKNGVYEDKESGFSLRPPLDWRADMTGTYGTLVVFTNPEFDVEGDNRYTANMNVVAETTDLSLEKYVESSISSLQQNFSNHKLISQREAGGLAGGVVIESTYDQGVFKLHDIHLITVRNGKAFVVTGAAVDSSWGKYDNLFNQVLASFQLK